MGLSYFLTAIVSFLGLFVGMALGKIAEEELKDGKKYFILMQRLILLISLGTILYFYKVPAIIIIAALWILSNLMFKRNIATPYYYLGLGIIYWLSAKEQTWHLLESSLIFLYGAFTGTVLFYEKRKLKYYLMHLVFFVSFLLYFL